uniref:Uncharacterized protein n=1 Tax=Meloidogyne incognita TaxID=6306 RepID=A0A914N2U8_MELIC
MLPNVNSKERHKFQRVLIRTTSNFQTFVNFVVAKPSPTRSLNCYCNCIQTGLQSLERTKVTINRLQKFARRFTSVFTKICPENTMIDVPATIKF